MKKLLFLMLLVSTAAGCSSEAPHEFLEFPLEKGTTWTYFYEAYDFPLTPGKSWCLQQPPDPQAPNSGKDVNCEFVGKRMATNRGAHQTPAGTFEDCYELTDYYNGGNIIHWFCTEIGIVSRRFDHTGTRFGFEQTLTGYSKGTP